MCSVKTSTFLAELFTGNDIRFGAVYKQIFRSDSAQLRSYFLWSSNAAQ